MFFEEFQLGQEFKASTRTITTTDVELFTSLTWAVNPLFLDDSFARQRGYPAKLVPGALVISYVIGLLYQTSIFEHITALVGIDKLGFKSSTHPGDVITARALVVEKKETRSADRGLVKFSVECLNLTRNTKAFEAEMVFLMLRKPLNNSKND
ncbi:MAG: MaoC/PaaZ C-terminal domain-containing protein [Candidatus Caldarchaeum sp.]|nr:MaoC/PaaZ C-terminal domain-containing protein [Candidatus Caldarchaeum sp.]